MSCSGSSNDGGGSTTTITIHYSIQSLNDYIINIIDHKYYRHYLIN